MLGISGEFHNIASALQDPQVADDLCHFLLFQGRKGRHACAGNSIADDAGQLAIHEVLHFGGGGDVRCVLSAAAICAMTSGAIGREDCGARRLRMQRTQRAHAKKTRTKIPRRQPIFVTGPLRSA